MEDRARTSSGATGKLVLPVSSVREQHPVDLPGLGGYARKGETNLRFGRWNLFAFL